MKIKEEHLDKTISCPFSGKMIWVRELDFRLYNLYFNKGYQWLFIEDEFPSVSEDEFFESVEKVANFELEKKKLK